MIVRRRTGRNRRRSDARLQAACEALPDAIVDLDEQGRVLSVNPAAESMLGYPPDELVGRPFRDLVPAFEHLHVLEWEHDPPQRVELEARRQDGTSVGVELSVARATHADQPIVVAILRDVSEWERVREALREREAVTQRCMREMELETERMRAIARSVSGATHEVNNLLAGLVGTADEMLDRLAPGDEPRRQLELVRQSALDAVATIRGVMALVAVEEELPSQGEGGEPGGGEAAGEGTRATAPGQPIQRRARLPGPGGTRHPAESPRTSTVRFERLPEPAPPEWSSRSGRRNVVLLVEDEPLARTAARNCLERLGYRVLEASSAREAMQLFRHESGEVDVALVDVVLPDDSGWELGRTLRRFLPRPSVVYMSAYSFESLMAHGLVDGGTPVVCKPFTRRSLQRAVETAVAESAALVSS